MITIDDSGVIFRDANPIIIPRDGNYDTFSLLGGFDDTPAQNITFASFTEDGKLKVDAILNVGDVTIKTEDIDIGDVNIRGKTDGGTAAVLLKLGRRNGGTETIGGIFSSGSSVSNTAAPITTAGGEILCLTVNADPIQCVTLGVSVTGAGVAADLQAKVRALTAIDPAKQSAFDSFTATFSGGQYTLKSGTTGATSTVVVGGEVQLDAITTPAGLFSLAVTDDRLTFTGDDLNVHVVTSTGTTVNVFDEVSAVVTNDPTIIAWYTVPLGKTLYVKHAMASGGNMGNYDLLVGDTDTAPIPEPIINEDVVARRRSYYTHFNVDFNFEAEGELGLKVEAGKVVALRVTHFQVAPDEVADFEGNIYGRLV